MSKMWRKNRKEMTKPRGKGSENKKTDRRQIKI
jgi:hypothetical protein